MKQNRYRKNNNVMYAFHDNKIDDNQCKDLDNKEKTGGKIKKSKPKQIVYTTNKENFNTQIRLSKGLRKQ